MSNLVTADVLFLFFSSASMGSEWHGVPVGDWFGIIRTTIVPWEDSPFVLDSKGTKQSDRWDPLIFFVLCLFFIRKQTDGINEFSLFLVFGFFFLLIGLLVLLGFLWTHMILLAAGV